MILDEVIKQAVQDTLAASKNHRQRTAELLGISRSTLYRYLRRYKLTPEPFRVHRRHTLDEAVAITQLNRPYTAELDEALSLMESLIGERERARAKERET